MTEYPEWTFKPAKAESLTPTGLRVVHYPDGKTSIQGSFRWWQGSDGGYIWRDLPVVRVDFDGKEVV